MPVRQEHTVTAPASSPVIPLDYMRSNFQASIFVDNITGSATWTIEVTADHVFAPGYDPATGNWQAVTDLTSLSGSGKGHLAYPACAMRMTTSGTGSLRLVVLEGGSEGVGA